MYLKRPKHLKFDSLVTEHNRDYIEGNLKMKVDSAAAGSLLGTV